MSATTPQTSTDSNRARLILASADAFAERGYEGASLRSIADAAGVPFQLITRYFGSKEDLWRATLDYLLERYLETGKALSFDLSGNVRLLFRNHMRLLLTDLIQRPQMFKIWTQEHFAASDRFASVIQPQIAKLMNDLTLPYLREAVRLGIVKSYSPEEIFILAFAVLVSNVVYCYPTELALGAETGTAKSINRQVDLLFDLLTASNHEIDGSEDGADSPPTRQIMSAPSPQSADWDSVEPKQHELERLLIENTDLKKLLADLLLKKATLHGKLRAAK